MSMIHLWEPASGSWTVDPIPLTGHTASVEDLQVRLLLFAAAKLCVLTVTVSFWAYYSFPLFPVESS